MKEKLLIIGGVAAGMSSASRARKLKPQLEITVLEKGKFISYSACGLPYFISDIVNTHQQLIVYDKNFFKEKRNINIFDNFEALKIEPYKKRAIAKDLISGKENIFEYTKLIITTGARAVIPQIPGVENKGVFVVKTLDDAIFIKNFISENKPKRAIIIGAGYVGMEMAESLKSLGIDLTVIQKSSNLLKNIEPEISEVVEKELKKNGVLLIKNTYVKQIEQIDKGLSKKIILSDGSNFDADIVIVSVGVKPNSEIAKDCGIALGKSGAINVNLKTQTNILNIFSAGDCAEVRHLVTGKNVFFPLGTTANKQGNVAGENAVGGNAVFRGIVGTSVVKVFDITVARTGLTEKEGIENGFDVITSIVEAPSKAVYYPGSEKIRIKLIAEKLNGRLLGAFIVGKDGVAKRIDVFATALHNKMTVKDISDLDLSYAPQFAPVMDPVIISAKECEKKRKKLHSN